MEAAYRTWNELRAEGDAAAADYRQLQWVTERQIEELKSREEFAQRVASEAKERADQAYAAYLAAKADAEAEEADFSADLAAKVSEANSAAAAEPLEARLRPPVADAEAKEADFWNTGAGSMTTLQMAEQHHLLEQAKRGVKRACHPGPEEARAEKADIEAWCARVPLMDRAFRAAKESRCWDCYVKTDHRDGPLSDPMSLPMCKDCYVSWTTER
jgi:hypothetical protein